MRAAIRSISSPDVDISNYRPDDPEDDGFLLTLYVGPADGPGEESFDLTVCTPTWLGRRAREVGPIVGRHYLIIQPLNLGDVLVFLTSQVEQLEAPTWDKLAEKIGRLGHWEFEDYLG